MTTEEVPSVVDETILVILAHPDDPEFYCGGTVARWAADNCSVHYCLLTRGDKGSDEEGIPPQELAKIREAEQRGAAEVIGVETVRFLDEPDGYLTASLALREKVVRVIRQVRPSIVVTCDPTNFFPSNRYINHADHRAAGQVALDAVFPAARSALYFPDLLHKEGLQPHKVTKVYVAGAQHPNMKIDITSTFDVKLQALSHHSSQIKDMSSLEQRLRKSYLDPECDPGNPRYIERFRYIELR
jgi:LmbE family N-acetylglucosaminyl deacetylase